VAEVIDYHTERFEDRVKGIDAVIDLVLVGGDTPARSFAVLRKGGVVATTVGLLEPAEAALTPARAGWRRDATCPGTWFEWSGHLSRCRTMRRRITLHGGRMASTSG